MQWKSKKLYRKEVKERETGERERARDSNGVSSDACPTDKYIYCIRFASLLNNSLRSISSIVMASICYCCCC